MNSAIIVFQKQKNALTVSTSRFEVDKEGGDIVVEVKANVDFQIAIAENCKDWISRIETKALTTRNLTFKIAPTGEMVTREGTITVSNGALSEKIKIFQAGEKVLILTEKEQFISDLGGVITAELSSNFDYEVVMPSVDWLKESTTKAISSHTRYFDVSPNESYDSRSAEIIFKSSDGSISETFTVTQAYKGAIVIGTKVYNLESDAQDLPITVSSNVDIEVEIPSDVDWISYSPATKGLTDMFFILTITENIEPSARTAEVTFKNTATNVSETITVTQSQLNAIVIGEKEYKLESNMQDLPITVSSNVDIEVEIPSDIDWISKAPDTRAMTDKVITLKITENGHSERTAKVTFKNTATNVLEEITITQKKILYLADFDGTYIPDGSTWVIYDKTATG